MILYCAGHETAVLRMLVHKLKNHRDEDMCYMTTIGTYPFGEVDRDYSFAYRCVMQINTAYGKSFTDEKAIIDGIVEIIDGAFATNGLDVNEFTQIYVVEDIYHPYTIYFETKNIPYISIELSLYSFRNKSKFNMNEHLYTRSVEYFNLCERIGAFTGEGKNCVKRIFDSESVNCFSECHKEYYNYVESISSLSKKDLNTCVELYSTPYNLKNIGEFSMVLTNSRGFIGGNFPHIDYLEIPRVYQKICDYYLKDLEKVYIKPHPNSYQVPYEKYFASEQIIDAKFLVDLVPFIENADLNTVVNVASTASVLLKKYCKNEISLGLEYFRFAEDVQAAGALLSYIDSEASIKTIYVAGFHKEQFRQIAAINFGSKYAVKSIDSFGNETDTDSCIIVANNLKKLWEAVKIADSYIGEKKLDTYQLIGKEYVKATCNYEEFRAYTACHKTPSKAHRILPHSGNVVDVRFLHITNDTSVTVMGGNIVRYVVPKLVDFTKATSVMWINPISDDIDYIDWNGLSDSDWLIFDLETLRYMLAEYNGIWYTDTNNFRNDKVYSDNKESITFINPMELDETIIAQRLDGFANKILYAFSSNKIIFLRNGLASYTCMGSRFAVNYGNDIYNKFMEKWEDFLIEKLHPHAISVWKNYFSLSASNKIIYEDEMYVDITNKIKAVMNGNSQLQDNELGYRPDCEIILKRYIKYYDYVQLRKYFSLFWEDDKYLSKYLIAFGKTFLEKYEHILTDMLERNVTECNIEAYLQERDINELLEAIKGGVDDIYAGKTCSYMGVFEYDFPIKKLLIKQMAAYYKEKGIVIADINTKNERYLYKLMLSSETPNKEEMNLLEATYRIPVDIWGSCVARNIFNCAQEYLYVKKYLFRVSMMNMDEKPLDVPAEWLKPEKLENEFMWRMIRIEFQRSAFEYFNQSDAKWLVVDMSNICSFTASYKGIPFSSVFDLTKEYSLWKYMKEDMAEIDYTDDVYTDGYFTERLKTACSYIKRRYGRKVIIVRTLWQDEYVGSNDIILTMERKDNEKLSKMRHITRVTEDYLYHQLECYMIDYTDIFYGSPVSISGVLSYLHYEDDFYKEAGYAIEKIVRTEPDERLVCDYRAATKLERAIRLLKHQENLPFLKKTYNRNWFDTVLVQIPVELIEKYQSVLEHLYHIQYKNPMDLLETATWLPTELKSELERVTGLQ